MRHNQYDVARQEDSRLEGILAETNHSDENTSKGKQIDSARTAFVETREMPHEALEKAEIALA